MRGKVKFYNTQRGFGFITREDNNEGIFFHHSDVGEDRYLEQNDEVEFSIGEGKEGKDKAINVKRIERQEDQLNLPLEEEKEPEEETK